MTKRIGLGWILAAVALGASITPLLHAANSGLTTASIEQAKKPKKKIAKKSKKWKGAPMPALSFKMKDIDGEAQDLRQFHGNVVLMVNTASRCGLTPHYAGLQKLYKKHKDQGFVILGFPANNFGGQEPGTNEEIKTFCTSKYDVTFPLFAKVSVKGDDKCDLYKYLTDADAQHGRGGEIEWNFAKFLINRKGEVVNRFHPRTKPEDEKLVEAIEAQIATAAPKDSPPVERAKKKARSDR